MRIFLKFMSGVAFATLLAPFSSLAGTAHGTSAGGPIPSGVFVTSGVVSSDIVLTAPGYVAAGNAVTVNLLGLQHDFAGDLQITLSYIDSKGNTVQSVDLLNRIGATAANPYGTSADFGANNGLGDNYQFNTDYSGNIWTVANCSDPPNCTEPYGDADSLPGVSTDTINNGQYFTSTTNGAKTNLSYAFTGLSVSGGTWRLTITDWADPNVGSYIGWEIYVTTSPTSTGGPSSAKYVGTDSTTRGNWSTTYGADGNLIANDSATPPSYATVSLTSDATYTWLSSTTDSRALLTSAGAVTRIASQYYSTTSFNVNVNLTDGGTHLIALYLLDFDTTSRSETITITDSVSGAVLDTETYSNFHNGVYAAWNVQGNVVIQVTTTGGPNSTVSGIFFGGGAPTTASATYTGTNTTTQGNWSTSYGADGNLIANNSSVSPSYASVNLTGDSTYTWSPSTTNPRALLASAGSTNRFASQFYSVGSFNINVNITDGAPHSVALYLLDWDTTSRTETITITDAVSGAILDSENYSNFQNGVYAVWSIKGNVVIQVTTTGGPNATVSGIFFGGAAPTTSSATYAGADTSTQGTWTNVYGTDGNLIATNSATSPSYATVSVSGDYTYIWSPSTTDSRALQTSSGATARIASQYFSPSSFNISVNINDGNTHRIALYLLDFDNANRTESITIKDAISGAVLDTENYSNFQSGVWAVWNIKGSVVIQVTTTGGPNATVSGIFFSPTPSATYTGNDTSTQGTWTNVYGTAGYMIAAGTTALPSYAAVSVIGDYSYTWSPSTADLRALQTSPGATTRIAAQYFSTTNFKIRVNLTDGNTHQVALYLLDWDRTGRAENISIKDAVSGAVLDTENYSSFQNGVWAVWNIKGNVIIQFTTTGGPNATVSGIFFN